MHIAHSVSKAKYLLAKYAYAEEPDKFQQSYKSRHSTSKTRTHYGIELIKS